MAKRGSIEQPAGGIGESASGNSGVTDNLFPKFSSGVTGTLVGLSEHGTPLVHFPGNPGPGHLLARSCTQIGQSDVGKEVVLLFEDGDGMKPIVIGIIQAAAKGHIEEEEINVGLPLQGVAVDIDGKTLTLTATETLTLRCGDASITLSRDGKILLRGTYLQSRSSGVNRIQGGSVQIN